MELVSQHGARVRVACADGCGALLDTGTSLLCAPSEVIEKIAQHLDLSRDVGVEPRILTEMGADCQASMPRLSFRLGGQLLSLPGTAMLGMVTGIMPAPWRLKYRQKPFVKVAACVAWSVCLPTGICGDISKVTIERRD